MVYEEFQLVTETTLTLIKERWLKYYPKITKDEPL